MIDEIKKSINSNLYERTRSPLYGTLIISWCFWNWKFLYYLLVVESSVKFQDRIEYIQNEITTPWTLIIGPIISTIAILVVFEFVANYAFWLHIYYKSWRNNKKVETEGKQLLTYEKSLQLRNDLRLKEEEYGKLIQEKESEIKDLESTIITLNKTKVEAPKQSEKAETKKTRSELLFKRLEKEEILQEFNSYASSILNNIPIESNEPLLKEFVTLGLISKGPQYGNGSKHLYTLTQTGTEVHDMILFK